MSQAEIGIHFAYIRLLFLNEYMSQAIRDTMIYTSLNHALHSGVCQSEPISIVPQIQINIITEPREQPMSYHGLSRDLQGIERQTCTLTGTLLEIVIYFFAARFQQVQSI